MPYPYIHIIMLCIFYASFLLKLDSKIQLTHDSSSIVPRPSYPNLVLSKASEFCNQSVIGSARSPLKVAKFSLYERLHFLN